MNNILNERELLPFIFNFIDAILNDLDNNSKFRKKKALKLNKTFARLRNFDINEDTYLFNINDKCFTISTFNNNVIKTTNIRLSNYFHMDKYFDEEAQKFYIFIFIPAQDKYYDYDDINFKSLIYSVLNLLGNNIFSINYYNEDINSAIENIIKYIMISVILYFTLEDPLDLEKEMQKFLIDHYGSESIYSKSFKRIYDILFERNNSYLNSIYLKDEKQRIISMKYAEILDNILEYI